MVFSVAQFVFCGDIYLKLVQLLWMFFLFPLPGTVKFVSDLWMHHTFKVSFCYCCHFGMNSRSSWRCLNLIHGEQVVFQHGYVFAFLCIQHKLGRNNVPFSVICRRYNNHLYRKCFRNWWYVENLTTLKIKSKVRIIYNIFNLFTPEHVIRCTLVFYSVCFASEQKFSLFCELLHQFRSRAQKTKKNLACSWNSTD